MKKVAKTRRVSVCVSEVVSRRGGKMATSEQLELTRGAVVPLSSVSHNWLDLESIYGIWLRDLKKFWRERSRLWGGIARPILWLIILGSSLRGAISASSLNGAANYQQYIFPGVIGLTLVFSALQSATSIIWDREFGF